MSKRQETQASEPKEYYTVSEAAHLLNVSVTTLWRWIDRNQLPAYRVGPKKIRIKKADLEMVVKPGRARGLTIRQGVSRDVWLGYDPKLVLLALERSFGALIGVDRDTLLADIHRERGQGDKGQPADLWPTSSIQTG